MYFRHSLAVRLVFAVLSVQAIFIGAIVGDLVHRDGATLERNRIERVRGLASVLSTGASRPLATHDNAALAALLASTRGMPALEYAMYLDPSGRILGHSDPSLIGSEANDPVTSAILHGPAASHVVARSASAVESAAAVVEGGRVVGWVRVRMDLADVRAAERSLGRWGVGYAIVALLLGLLVSLVVARAITRRLEDLSAMANRFRLGDHEVRADEHGADEIAQVARGLNQMLDTVVSSERALNETQRTAKLGTWEYDTATGISTWSDATYELFGFDPQAAAPPLAEFLATFGDKDARYLGELLTGDENPRLGGVKLVVTRPDGEQRVCWLEARVRQIPGSLQRIFYGSCQDITDREVAAEQLRQAQKMEAVGQLTGGIAHDFNNLLAIIIGNLDFLQDEVADQSKRESVDEALGAALRGAELTRQLLAFSRRQPLAVQVLDLNDLVSRLASLWKRMIGPEIEVKVSLAKRLWRTSADPTQLEAALLNLVINARDAMPGGGTLTVATANLRTAEPIASGFDSDGLPAGDYVLVTISDTGEGMSREVAARVFEPFFTTKPAGRGTGLGLSMIYGFARQSGGQVHLESELGLGTSVTIYLPRATHAREDKPGDARDSASGETVLLVDDDAGVLQVAARQLRELGYTVVTAESGAEALAKLARLPKVDLLLTDIVMPGGMNGFELTQRARALNPGLKFLHASGFTLNATEQTGLDSDVQLLTKPYRKADLASKVREVLDEERP